MNDSVVLYEVLEKIDIQLKVMELNWLAQTGSYKKLVFLCCIMKLLMAEREVGGTVEYTRNHRIYQGTISNPKCHKVINPGYLLPCLYSPILNSSYNLLELFP